jgi:hypothetical protein
MPFLNGEATALGGRRSVALLMTGSYPLPDGIEIGTGSGTKTTATSGLITPVLFAAFTTTDTTTPQFVTFTADFTSTQLSGLTIKELAVKRSGGAYWSADGFPGITFDGSTEMQATVTWEVF